MFFGNVFLCKLANQRTGGEESRFFFEQFDNRAMIICNFRYTNIQSSLDTRILVNSNLFILIQLPKDVTCGPTDDWPGKCDPIGQ
jgi:hypothetical protein